MFSGIIEETSNILRAEAGSQSLRIWISRPANYNDIHLGDSIAVNGVCLTVEEIHPTELVFTLGAETLKVLGFADAGKTLQSKPVNMERSMRLGDRVHGHLVSGHVDLMVELVEARALGDSWLMRVRLPASAPTSPDKKLPVAVWKKGSITLNGVSLTVNELSENGRVVEVCLIPETMKRTNLPAYKVGEMLTVEMDWMAKGVLNALQNMDLEAILKLKRENT